jgi:hypothetical protein
MARLPTLTVVGLFSLYRLRLVREEGEVEERVIPRN